MKVKIVRAIAIIVIAICVIKMFIHNIGLINDNEVYNSLKEEVTINENNNTEKVINNIDKGNNSTAKKDKDEKRLDLDSNRKNINGLYNKNSDLIGWITNNDKIDYPIMQCSSNSNFYINKNFYKQYSASGSLYIPNDIDMYDKITIVYGHHMKNGTMFGSLEKYLDKNYIKKHSILYINTLNNIKGYEVLGTFITNDNNKFYEYRGNINKDDFYKYKENIKSILKVGNIDDIEYDDNILELVTCWYNLEGSKLVVICREVK